MSDPRGFLSRLLYSLSEDYRTAINRTWQQRHGTPPPWTASGRHYQQDLDGFNELLANPPPIHGDARWMGRDEAQALAEDAQHGDAIEANDAFYLGNAVDMQRMEIHCPAVSRPPGHVLTIAATRAGKGAAQIVPNLAIYGGSMLVIDPKGENYARTHRHRRKISRVFRIDPFCITEDADPDAAFSCFNPLASVSESSDALRLAEMLLGEAPEGEGRFFYDEGLQVLTAVLLYVARSPVPTLTEVRRLLCLADDPSDMAEDKAPLRKAFEAIIADTEDAVIKNPLSTFIGKFAKLRTSILATINAKMAIWDEAAISRTVSDHHFDLEGLKTGKVTVYVILPFDKLKTYQTFLRMFVGLFYQAMIRDAKQPDIPVACVIDEFPALGQMTELVGALAEIGGYGVRFWLFVQGLAQLKAIYPRHHELILSQCATKCIYGVTDGATAEWLSKEVGNTTVATSTLSLGNSGGGLDGEGYPAGGASTGRNIQLAAQPLLSVNEIRKEFGVGGDMTSRKRFQVVFLSGHAPMVATLEPWFADPVLSEILLDNPKTPALAPKVAEALPWWTGLPADYAYGIKDSGKDDGT